MLKILLNLRYVYVIAVAFMLIDSILCLFVPRRRMRRAEPRDRCPGVDVSEPSVGGAVEAP